MEKIGYTIQFSTRVTFHETKGTLYLEGTEYVYNLIRRCIPVSYTHLDVYKRQIIPSEYKTQHFTNNYLNVHSNNSNRSVNISH